MTVAATRSTTPTTTVPRPRAAQDDAPPDQPAGPTVGEFPWPEPWRRNPGARPRSEYWDVASASWRSRGPRAD